MNYQRSKSHNIHSSIIEVKNEGNISNHFILFENESRFSFSIILHAIVMVMLRMMNRPFLYASDFDQMSISCCRFNQMIILKISLYFYKYKEVITSHQTLIIQIQIIHYRSLRLNLEIFFISVYTLSG